MWGAFFMAIKHRVQGHIEKLAEKNGSNCTSQYLSDQKSALFGDRQSDFITYVGTEDYTSDAQVRFYSANGASTGNRRDKLESEFIENGSYP